MGKIVAVSCSVPIGKCVVGYMSFRTSVTRVTKISAFAPTRIPR